MPCLSVCRSSTLSIWAFTSAVELFTWNCIKYKMSVYVFDKSFRFTIFVTNVHNVFSYKRFLSHIRLLLHRKCGHWRKTMYYENYLCYMIAWFLPYISRTYIVFFLSDSLFFLTSVPQLFSNSMCICFSVCPSLCLWVSLSRCLWFCVSVWMFASLSGCFFVAVLWTVCPCFL